MSEQCEIVQDLLPLYVDGACSEASARLVKEHLDSCVCCREIYQKMCSHTNEDILQKEKAEVIVRHERKENQKVLKYLFFAIAVIYLPALLLVALFAGGDVGLIATPYLFDLLVLFLYTFPCYLAFLELGLTACRVFEKRERSNLEKVFNTVGIVLACAIILTAFDLERLLYLSLALAVVLVLNWTVAAIACKKKPDLSGVFRQKTFWISVVILIAVLAVVIAGVTVFFAMGKVREEPLEVGYSIGVRECGSDLEGVSFDIGMEEQHAWNVIDKDPTFTVKWVNSTRHDVEYNLKCYIYKETSDGWGLCASDYVEFPDTTYTLPAGGQVVQEYSIKGYTVNESGRYKFVTFVEEKAVWVEFEVTIEGRLGTE